MEKFRENHNRKLAVEQGFYDGRFIARVVPDKRKKTARDYCRKSNKIGFNVNKEE